MYKCSRYICNVYIAQKKWTQTHNPKVNISITERKGERESDIKCWHSVIEKKVQKKEFSYYKCWIHILYWEYIYLETTTYAQYERYLFS